jgi:hypothetical protein
LHLQKWETKGITPLFRPLATTLITSLAHSVYCSEVTKKGKIYACLECCNDNFKVCSKCNLNY